MTTGEKIRELRRAKGMTQEELGNKIGVQKAAINKYETGIVVNYKRSTLAAIAHALDVSPLFLLDYDDLSSSELSNDEHVLLDTYRSLPQEGKQYIQKQLTFATMEYGGKSEDLSSSRPG